MRPAAQVFLKMGYGKNGWAMGKGKEIKEMRRRMPFRAEVLGLRN
jgi:hypothetical protein